jgi:hypothetical protein
MRRHVDGDLRAADSGYFRSVGDAELSHYGKANVPPVISDQGSSLAEVRKAIYAIIVVTIVCLIMSLMALPSRMNIFMLPVLVICALSFSFALYLTEFILKKSDQRAEMQQVSNAIKLGSEGFLNTQYGAIAKLACVIGLVLVIIYLFRTPSPSSKVGSVSMAIVTLVTFVY